MTNTDKINAIATLSLQEAIAKGLEMLESMSFKKSPEKKARIINDIRQARRPIKIVETLWNLELAKDGFQVINSQWQRQYR